MMAKATSGSSNDFQELQMFPVTEYLVSPSVEATSASAPHSSGSLLFHLSLLKDKLSQLHNLVAVLVSPEHNLSHDSTSMAISTINSTIQEIIVAATSMRFTCQQMVPAFGSTSGTTNQLHHQQQIDHHRLQLHQSNFDNSRVVPAGNINIASDVTIKEQSLFHNTEAEALDWFVENYSSNNNNNSSGNGNLKDDEANRGELMCQGDETDIIELDAVDLLARYTHFCQVCGKGFKRDANLRMHMRAHGDEYKTSAALSNPMKNIKGSLLGEGTVTKKYSCPQEGCRWNQKHARFQPLKSMVCVKNHYKRSHCPKMYMCKRCNQKQFSVLSDLRTHEKHCGDPRWLCSCGTTFSRKDKLMGHVALFVGHTPAISGSEKSQYHMPGTRSST